MPDHAAQRRNMIEAQIRANDVTDTRIQAAMGDIPRERFVPAAKRAVAYTDVPVEVVAGRWLMDPRSFAKLVQLASIKPTDTILDVGCATGYSTAVLARLGKSVMALEQDADLVRIAPDMLQAVKAANASVVQGSLADGYRLKAPYDVIFINGASRGRTGETSFAARRRRPSRRNHAQGRAWTRATFRPPRRTYRPQSRFRRLRSVAGRFSHTCRVRLLRLRH